MAKRVGLKPCSVIFNPDDHSCYLPEKDKFLSGITGMLERQLFPNTYDGIPGSILRQAAEYGTQVHEAIEDFDMNWQNDGTQEVQDYIDLCTEHGLVHEASEYLISDDENFASMIDKIYRVDDDTFDLCDLKTFDALDAERREKIGE